MSRDPNKMDPPPAGFRSEGILGDKPIDMPDEDDHRKIPVHFVCILHGDWPLVGSEFKKKHQIPDLGARYAENVYQMVSRYAPRHVPWRFTCFTDRYEIPGVPIKRLPEGLYGWWGKLWLFAPGVFKLGERVICLDLDTAIVGSLTPLTEVDLSKPLFLRDIWGAHHAASGVFSFIASEQYYPIWQEFIPFLGRRPPYIPTRPHPMANAKNWGQVIHECRTDEQWFHHFIYPDGWRAWQDILPDAFLSYKYNILRLQANAAPAPTLTKDAARAAKIVFFHGQPRPHDVIAKWNPHWRGIHPTPPELLKVEPHRVGNDW